MLNLCRALRARHLQLANGGCQLLLRIAESVVSRPALGAHPGQLLANTGYFLVQLEPTCMLIVERGLPRGYLLARCRRFGLQLANLLGAALDAPLNFLPLSFV